MNSSLKKDNEKHLYGKIKETKLRLNYIEIGVACRIKLIEVVDD